MKNFNCALFLTICYSLPIYASEETNNKDTADISGPSPLEERIDQEKKTIDNPFVITPHKPTYILPVTYNSSPNQAPYQGTVDGDIDNVEIKFQISFKIPLVRDLFDDNGHLAVAYTQQSYWQAYNSAVSAPFRETDHEPEVMLTFTDDHNILGFKNRFAVFGFVHQSNGRAELLSRSWNRIYANFILERGRLVLSVKPWYRIPEDENDDDNPDIDDYMGYGEYSAAYKKGNHTYSLMLRNNFRSNNKGAVQIDWSFPMYQKKLRGYVQYFNGYGESLIDYNDSTNRLGVGVILNAWL